MADPLVSLAEDVLDTTLTAEELRDADHRIRIPAEVGERLRGASAEPNP